MDEKLQIELTNARANIRTAIMANEAALSNLKVAWAKLKEIVEKLEKK